jgi:methionyl aminopeptidase
MSTSFKDNNLITLKDKNWFDRQVIAGKCVRACLSKSREMINDLDSIITLKKIELECFKIIKSMDCMPTFYGYLGFPGFICASVNNQLVHGIPSEYELKEGDIVKIDLGATYKGAIADSAITVIRGKEKDKNHVELVKKCEECLTNAINNVEIGKRMGIIGSSIHHTVKNTRFGLITNYGGHGISENEPHSNPFVENKSDKNSGVRICAGMTFAIEPMLVIGDTRTTVGKDGWTVSVSGMASHFEHTLYVGEDKVYVMTRDF